MSDKLLHRHVFCFNEEDNGGESLTLKTEFYDNGDAAAGLPAGIYTNQELSLMSYGNSASFNLSGAAFTPELLRQLANELESAMIKAEAAVVPLK
jgi:hypothetical protein